MVPEPDVTALLIEVANGNQAAQEKLVPLVYDQLKRLARRYMRRERASHTLQTTALVHEAYLKLVGQHSPHWQGRAQFYGVAAQLMRRILIDHARRHLREKRGGTQVIVPLEEGLAFTPEHSEDLLKLDEASRPSLEARSAAKPHRRIALLRRPQRGGNLPVSERLPDHGQAGLGGGESLAVRRIEARPWR